MTFERKSHFVVTIQFRPDDSSVSTFAFLRVKTDIPDIVPVRLPQEYIAEYAVIAEHVLGFQVGSIAPSVDDNQQFVLSFMEIRIDIEFCCIVGAFGISCESAVDVHIRAACNTEESEFIDLREIVYFKERAVDTDEVVFFARIEPLRSESYIRTGPAECFSGFICLRDLRRVERELISRIQIEWPVVFPELPAGWDIDLIKGYFIRIEDIRQLGRSRIEPEVPVSVEADHLR